MSNLEIIKKLREETSVGILDAKKALEATNNNFEEAKKWIRDRGLSKSAEKSSRVASEGVIGSYIHQNKKIGVLVKVSCETDFVARTDEFNEFAHNLAMQIAGMNPIYVSIDDIPEDELSRLKAEFAKEAEGKPDLIKEKIIEGKINKYAEEFCLLEQAYIKDDKLKIKNLLGEMVSKFGENIKVTEFVLLKI